MGMRDKNSTLTICEVLRLINDRLQGEEYSEIRDMLALSERMAKRIVKKLNEYNRKFEADSWGDSRRFEEVNRELASYKIGNDEAAERALKCLSR